MTLVFIDDDQGDSIVVPRVPRGDANREHPLRDLVFAHPEILPLRELEPEIGRIVSVATELNLPGAGFIDVLLVSEHGRLVVVECKLWRNPQARREVVGQVLDYARELARYGYEDLQRVVSSRLGCRGNALYELASEAGATIDEASFVDRVTRDLTAGRFMLVIAGDGITEGTRRIGEYLGAQAGLAFDLAMVEIAEYRFADPVSGRERRVVQPRLLAQTETVERFVVRSEVEGISVEAIGEQDRRSPTTRAGISENHAAWRAFVDHFVAGLSLDDPAQALPRIGGLNWMRMPFPGPADLTLYRTTSLAETGAFLRYREGTGFALFGELASQREAIDGEFRAAGLPVPCWDEGDDEQVIAVTASSPLPWDAAREDEQRAWLARVANQFVNSMAPRVSRALG